VGAVSRQRSRNSVSWLLWRTATLRCHTLSLLGPLPWCTSLSCSVLIPHPGTGPTPPPLPARRPSVRPPTACRYYEPIVKKSWDNLLDVTAIVLANLCVSYIMTSQNEEAEEIMRRCVHATNSGSSGMELPTAVLCRSPSRTKRAGECAAVGPSVLFEYPPSVQSLTFALRTCRVEAEEARVLADAAALAGAGDGMAPAGAGAGGAAKKPIFHLCIINLVIGTLYCSKGNYEFGVSRILKSLEPLDRKLGPDTWYYAKRCFVALAEVMAKHMITLRDAVVNDILSFLEEADKAGKAIVTVIAQGSSNAAMSATTGSPAAGSAAAGAGTDSRDADAAGTSVLGASFVGASAALPGLGGPSSTRTVSYEARLLRRMFMHLKDEH